MRTKELSRWDEYDSSASTSSVSLVFGALRVFCFQRRDDGIRTPNLLKPFTVNLADLKVLLFEHLQAAGQRVGDLEVLVGIVVAAGPGVVEGRLHLADGVDGALGLVDHVLLLGGYQSDLVVQGFGESVEELNKTGQLLRFTGNVC